MGKNKKKKSKIYEIGTDIEKTIKYVIPFDEFDINFLQLNYNKFKVRNDDNVVPLWSLQWNKPDNNYYEFEITVGSDENSQGQGISNPINEIANIQSTYNENKTNIVPKLNTSGELIDFTTYMKLVNVLNESNLVIAGDVTDQESLIDYVAVDKRSSVKTDHEEKAKSKDVNTVQLVTLHVLTGEKLKVSMSNFHGFWKSGNSIQCRICMVMVEDVEAHKMEIQHMRKIGSTISNKDCIRKIGPLWNHCMLCNEVIENIEFHLKANTAHAKHLKKALNLSTNYKPNTSKQNLVDKTVIQKIKSHVKKAELILNRPVVAAVKKSVINNDTDLSLSNKNNVSCNICNRKMQSNQLKAHINGKLHKAQLLKNKTEGVKGVATKCNLASGSGEKNKILNLYKHTENISPDQPVTENFKKHKDIKGSNVEANRTDKKHLAFDDESVLTSNECKDIVICNVCNRKMQCAQLEAHIKGKSHNAQLLKIENKIIKKVTINRALPSGSGIKNTRSKEDESKQNSGSDKTDIQNFKINRDKEVRNVESKDTCKKRLAFNNDKLTRVLTSNQYEKAAFYNVSNRKMQSNQLDTHKKAGDVTDQESLIDYVAVDKGLSIKTDHNETVKNKDFDTDQLVTLHVLSGEKLKVSMRKFHGFRKFGDGIQCRICMVMLEDVEAHTMEIQHMKRIGSTIYNKHCIREIGPTWNHCVLCNEIIQNVEFHLKGNTTHTKHLEQALNLSTKYQPIANVCTTPEMSVTNFNKPINSPNQNVDISEIQKLDSHIMKTQLLLKDQEGRNVKANDIYKTQVAFDSDKSVSTSTECENATFCNLAKLQSDKAHLKGKLHKRQLLKLKDEDMKRVTINCGLQSGSEIKNIRSKEDQHKQNSVSYKTDIQVMIHKDSDASNVQENDTDKKYLASDNDKNVITLDGYENVVLCNVCNMKLHINLLESHKEGKYHKEMLYNKTKSKEISENLTVKSDSKCEIGPTKIPDFDNIFQNNLYRKLTNCNGDRYDDIIFNALFDTFSELRTSTSSPRYTSQQNFSDNVAKAADASIAVNAKSKTASYSTNIEKLKYLMIQFSKFAVGCQVCRVKFDNSDIEVLKHVNSEKHIKKYTYLLNQNTLRTENENVLHCEACKLFVCVGTELFHIRTEHHKKEIVTKVSSSASTCKRLIYCDLCNSIIYLCLDKIYEYDLETCCSTAILYKHCVEIVDFDRLYCRYCSKYLPRSEVFFHILTHGHLSEAQTDIRPPYTICYQMKFYTVVDLPICQICKERTNDTVYYVLLHLQSYPHRSKYKKLLIDNKIKEYGDDMFFCQPCNAFIKLQDEIDHIEYSHHRQMLEKSKQMTWIQFFSLISGTFVLINIIANLLSRGK